MIHAMGSENEDGSVTGYMCLTEWEYEIGLASAGITVYPNVEGLRKRRNCVKSCGIVEVRISYVCIVQEPEEEE